MTWLADHGAQVLFWIFAGGAIGSALACVTRRSPVASALWLVVTMFQISALFVLLDAQFLALGHPFVDAMLEHAGSYDLGGLTAIRQIKEPSRAGQSGYLFIFIVRQRITHQDGDECLFRFQPLFVRVDGVIDEEAASLAVAREAFEDSAPPSGLPDPEESFHFAKEHLEKEAGLWEWDDDVEFLGLSWVQFI